MYLDLDTRCKKKNSATIATAPTALLHYISLSSEFHLLLDYVNCTLGPTECMAAARRLVPG